MIAEKISREEEMVIGATEKKLAVLERQDDSRANGTSRLFHEQLRMRIPLTRATTPAFSCPARRAQNSRRWALLATCLVASLALCGCNEDEDSFGAVTESFQQQLEQKDKELKELRSSEAILRADVAEMRGKLDAVQAELNAARSKPPLDVAGLAKELAPLLGAAQPERRRPEAPTSADREFEIPAPKRNASTASEPRPRSSPPTEDVRRTNGDTRRRIDVDWGDGSRR